MGYVSSQIAGACRCNTPIIEPIEFEIPDDQTISCGKRIFNFVDITELKDKVVCEYNDIITLLECGHKPDLEILLEEISLIDIYGD